MHENKSREGRGRKEERERECGRKEEEGELGKGQC